MQSQRIGHIPQLFFQQIAFKRPYFFSGILTSNLSTDLLIEIFRARCRTFACNIESIPQRKAANCKGGAGEYVVILINYLSINHCWSKARGSQSLILNFSFDLVFIHDYVPVWVVARMQTFESPVIAVEYKSTAQRFLNHLDGRFLRGGVPVGVAGTFWGVVPGVCDAPSGASLP